MKRALVTTILVLAATALAAQNTSQTAPYSATQQASKNFAIVPLAPTCPMSLHALQGFGTGLVAVRNAKPVTGVYQRIHLIVGDNGASHVVRAKVVVRGLSARNQMLPTLASEEHSDLSKTLDVTFAPEAEKAVSADLVLPGFTSVRSIQIQSIDYQNGATWAIAGRVCYVAPDPMMLVAGR